MPPSSASAIAHSVCKTSTDRLVIDIEEVRAARDRIKAMVVQTPTIHNVALSRMTGADVVLKLENLQAIGSFKERGAANRMALLNDEECRRGVITVSAGNHAQGVARQASLLGIDAKIVMPRCTPATKIAATESWGARVVLAGENFDEACQTAEDICRQEGRILIHPFNDPAIIAGQGTCALEMIEAVPDLDAVIIPVGGGGLVAGFVAVLKTLTPHVKIYAVQVDSYAPLAASASEIGKDVRGGTTIAEGIAVAHPGIHCLSVIGDSLEDVLVVDERQVEGAITTLAEKARQVCEGAGATPLAAMLAYPDLFRGQKTGLVLTGGNINARIFSHVILRSLLNEGRILRLVFQIPDRPGLLADISRRIGLHGGNIIEVAHHRLFAAPSVQTAELVIMLEARDSWHGQQIEEELARYYHVSRE